MNSDSTISARMRSLPIVLTSLCCSIAAQGAERAGHSVTISKSTLQFVQNYCVACHGADTPEGDLNLEREALNFVTATKRSASERSASEPPNSEPPNSEPPNSEPPNSEPESDSWKTWEHVLKRLETRQMPPPDSDRPSERAYSDAVTELRQALDQLADDSDRVGRVPTFRRLTRTEYQNAIRDLLQLNVDATELLPKDEASFGFDNITVTRLTPTLLNRYVKAAQIISTLAVSASSPDVVSRTIRIPPDQTQAQHVVGLPLGTRGGLMIDQFIAEPGEYEISVRLMRDRNEEVEGLTSEHELRILLNRRSLASFKIQRPKNATEHLTVDQHLKTRLQIPAGQQKIGVTFVAKSDALIETRRQPLNVQFNHHRHRRQGPAVYSVSITGPYSVSKNRDTETDTASRRLLLKARPSAAKDAEPVATQTLRRIMRLAYRRPVNDADMKVPLQFFQEAFHKDSGERNVADRFEAGIQAALEAILVNPNFLLRVQRQPPGVAAGDTYSVDGLELASRLSFFLWSSLPDERLLGLAESGDLKKPEVLDAQVRRMLKDGRSDALVTNFARQWLYLNNLKSVSPDARLFPDFDQNLRTAMQQETELFFRDMLRHDRSVTALLKSDFTFLNERLARHYEIPSVIGSRFRKVKLKPEDRRGGLLRHGSLLTVTSYATRTSPVLRGNWILKNILGTPPPPPPENVPALKDNTVDATLSVRERLNEHRANPACAGCHNLMDPIGFSLESYDAVGRYRPFQEGRQVDLSGGLPDGRECHSVADLEAGLVARPEIFVATFTERLMTFGLGRGLTFQDRASIRRIVDDAAQSGYRFSDLVMGIVHSQPFLKRTAE